MVQASAQQQAPLSTTTMLDNTHGWLVQRCCQVFAVPQQLQAQWRGLKTFVVIEPEGSRHGKLYQERQFYICSQSLSAQQLLADAQGHWGIENRLHWVTDVTFGKDFPQRRGGNAPVNWAVLHNFCITIARYLRFRTIPQAKRALSNQLEKVFSVLV